jgi:hypothetical protein
MTPAAVPDVFSYIGRKPQLDPVYIIGSGPCGPKGVARIPAQAQTIALNSAILYKREFTFWMAFDRGTGPLGEYGGMRAYPWWRTIVLPEETCTVFGIGLVQDHFNSPEHTSGHIPMHYGFKYRPTCSRQASEEMAGAKPRSPLTPGLLRGGVNIAGCALQFAAWAGAKKIILAGVDMRGNGHYDGFTNPKMTTGEWGICRKLKWLIAGLKRHHGIDVVSLTPTALGVPLI